MTSAADQEFSAFYEANFHRVANFSAALAFDREDARDLTQDAFARTWVAWNRARQADDPTYFTMRVVANLAFSAFRRVRRLRALSPSLFVRDEGDPTAVIDERLVVGRAIRGLPRRERMSVVLAYLADLPAEDVASIMGISPSTVRVHLHHARVRLGAILGPEQQPIPESKEI